MMADWTGVLILLPLASFIALALGGRRLSERATGILGAGSIVLAAALALVLLFGWLTAPPAGGVARQALWHWMDLGGWPASFSLRLDALSLVMALVVTIVGAAIHIYSVGFMRGEEGYARFFASMNLFVAFMLLLVLADNLLVLYLGWEGVGLCSYLLIGFWYKKDENGYAARKAFVVTRLGDAALTVGLFLLLAELGTLDFGALGDAARSSWAPGATPAVAATALLLAGAIGKSAQLPLQTWLPDAMAGPTPVSALIHAATMVAAGVYLVARTEPLFVLAPSVMLAVAVIGAATLLVAGVSALAQRDLKRILAYSTISQLGYMYLALGVGAWTAAIFHLVTHACFKALLFLAAGVVIQALHHERDIRRMGGLARRLPVAFATFTIGAASLAALPLVTAGYYSKDLILFRAWTHGGPILWLAGLAGALITGLYIFRAVFVVFLGKPRFTGELAQAESSLKPPLYFLAALSIVAGFIQTPAFLGGVSGLSDFLASTPAGGAALGGELASPSAGLEAGLGLAAAAASLGGIALAYVAFRRRPEGDRAPFAGRGLDRALEAGLGFDWLYDRAIVRPYVAVARFGARDLLDAIPRAVATVARRAHQGLLAGQTGRLRSYASAIALGAILLLALSLLE